MAGAGTDDSGDGDEERIHVGETSEGSAADATAGVDVDLPVVELLTGRGFVTGKSGSGKSNTASVVIEKLLDRGLSAMIVDIDGEYYGLKEEYEILHVGADEECDLVVDEEHAGKLAELALEQKVPIILDVSSFLDETDARALLTSVARHLFAKEKKLKQPFLLVVEEVHEFIPEGGGLDECGRMLIKAAKRGRKHGLGVVGVSQRPADVKKDFITQCDWLVWHRLTWENDTKVVSRILGREYADAIEGVDDGEAFVLTDWSERVRRVQFERKRTFDAGATPGLDDFERPELKSVSSDLVQDLEAISEAEERRESRIQELERQLADREERIEDLEAELEEAKDLSRMAERFSRAMMEHVSGRAFRQDVTAGTQKELDDWRKRAVRGEHLEATRRPAHPPEDDASGSAAADAPSEGASDDEPTPAPDEPETEATAPPGWPDDEGTATGDGGPADDGGSAGGEDSGGGGDAPMRGDTTGNPSPRDGPDEGVDIDAAFEALAGEAVGDGDARTTGEADDGDRRTTGGAEDDDDRAAAETGGKSGDGNGTHRDEGTDATAVDEPEDWPELVEDGATDEEVRSTVETAVESGVGFEREVVRDLKAAIRRLGPVARRMLAHYREHGPCDPVDAHVAAGGDGDRTRAYSRNRALRGTDLVAHVGRGNYGYRLPAELRDRHDDRLPDEDLAEAVAQVEAVFLDGGADSNSDGVDAAAGEHDSRSDTADRAPVDGRDGSDAAGADAPADAAPDEGTDGWSPATEHRDDDGHRGTDPDAEAAWPGS